MIFGILVCYGCLLVIQWQVFFSTFSTFSSVIWQLNKKKMAKADECSLDAEILRRNENWRNTIQLIIKRKYRN